MHNHRLAKGLGCDAQHPQKLNSVISFDTETRGGGGQGDLYGDRRGGAMRRGEAQLPADIQALMRKRRLETTGKSVMCARVFLFF